MRIRAALVVVLAAALTGTAPAAQRTSALITLLDRAAAYVDGFVKRFPDAVAEERYRQQIEKPLRQRMLISDFFVTRSAEADDLLVFRDVLQVDRQLVRSRDDRLMKLFADSPATAVARAHEVAVESSRHNLAEIGTDISLLALSFLHRRYSSRFRFSLGPVDPDLGPGIRVVSYEEFAVPTILRSTEANRNLFAHGRFWIEESTGRVVRTEMKVRGGLGGAIDSACDGCRDLYQVNMSFRPDEAIGLNVPSELREWRPGVEGNFTSVATYGPFRFLRLQSGGASTLEKPPVVDALLTRASEYMQEFVDRLSNVVAEETYNQSWNGSGRQLVSDFLLVKDPSSGNYHAFRDVIRVDGGTIRDREERLTKLFLGSSPATTIELATAINAESGLYTFGGVFSNPVAALAFLQAPYQPRFLFSLGAPDRTAGPNVWIVNYQEWERPTILRGPTGDDSPADGRFWIDLDNGRVLKSELTLPNLRISTAFRFDGPLQIAVPVEMTDRYMLQRASVTGKATYGRFRRFQVTSDEKIDTPRQ